MNTDAGHRDASPRGASLHDSGRAQGPDGREATRRPGADL
jgi:hypothetical protein